MKKTFLLFTTIIFWSSCNKETSNFNEIGDIKIGEKFSSIPNYKSFRKVMENEFFIEKYELSNDIGEVNRLNVSTENDTIIEVKFSSSEETNINKIEKSFSNFIEEKIDLKKLQLPSIDETPMRFFKSKDEKMFLVVRENKYNLLKNGKPSIEYHYSNTDAIEKNRILTAKMIGLDKKKILKN